MIQVTISGNPDEGTSLECISKHALLRDQKNVEWFKDLVYEMVDKYLRDLVRQSEGGREQ